MKNLLHPHWLFLINTLPIAVFLILGAFEFSVVRTLLDVEDFILWEIFAVTLLLVSAATFIYAMRIAYKNEEISSRYAIITLVAHIVYIVFYLFYLNDSLLEIPSWMLSSDFQIYVVTFLMPTIIHALFVLVLKLNWKSFENGWLNLLAAILIPFLIFLFIQIGLPLWDEFDSDGGELLMIIFFCFIALSFLFFVMRGMYFIIAKRKENSPRLNLILKIIVAIIFPIWGLLFNQGFLGRGLHLNTGEGLFGNFGNPWFFILATLNGVLVCLPEAENPKYRLALFGGRTLTFTYITYFFLVFLPYLPLSVLAVIAVGFGFLMLTPLIVFILQSRLLTNDFAYLAHFYSKDKLRIIGVVAFLVIPTAVTVNYWNDKTVLNETLDYIYYPDYSKKYDLNERAVQRILSNVKAHKKSNGGFLSNNSHTPFLSRFYTWLVLDNMTLSDNKINKIESIFLGESSAYSRMREWSRNDTTVEITNIQTKTEYDATQDTWLTWVDFEMTNLDTNSWEREYDVAFDLPAGCYVSDYYLDISGKREYGILSEKRAAVWIYQQITNTNRDPGLLNYIASDKVRFRVFPFLNEEKRTTGIQFLHKEPVEIQIDNHKIQLGKTENSPQKSITTATDLTKNVVYISAFAKSKLPRVKRQPYYHFIVDISGNAAQNSANYISKIDTFIEKYNVDLNKAEFNFTNKYSTISNAKDWKTQLKNQKFEGGFYTERAIEKALLNAYENRKNEYPIIVVVSEDYLDQFILEDDFSNLKLIYPELNQYYKIENDGSLIGFDLTNNPKKPIDSFATITVTPMVLAYPNAKNPIIYLPNDNTASVVLKSSISKNDFDEISEKSWESALTMHGNWLSQNLHPETAEMEYYELVKSSFKSNIMSPVTSFIALENEVQKQMLKKKQKEVLWGNKALDLGEQPDSMSEPELCILLMLFGIFIWFWKKD
jgi:putative effector of murein hydrolase LrgA (UPF0299 family)